MPSAENTRFAALLSQLLDGSLDEGQAAELQRLLETDADRRTRFLEFCQVHAILLAEHGALYATVEDAAPGTAPAPAEGAAAAPAAAAGGGSRKAAWAMGGFVAASLLVAASLYGVAKTDVLVAKEEQTTQVAAPRSTGVPAAGPGVPERGRPVARVAKVAAADFTHGIDGHTPVAEGVPMPAGRYNLLAGLIELEYASGARLVIQAPADFQLVDDQTVGLSSGRLAAHVPEPAAGFVVETAGGRIIDLGTAFGVEADESNGTAIYVFDGEVSVEPAGRVPQDEKRLTLVGGTATRIDSVTGTPAGIAFDDQKILRSFSNGQSRYSAGVRALGPTLYYEMEPTPSGSILYDTSSAPQPSQHAGHTAWIAGDANRSVLWCAGKVGTAIEMHGPRDGTWIAAPDYPRAEQDALSIVAWVYAETRPMWASIAKNWGESTCGQAHLGLRGYGGELAAHITDRNGQEVAAVDTAPLPLHSWQHVAMVVEGDELRLYRNGERVASTATDGLGVNPSLRKLAIGCKLNDEESGPVPFGQWDGRLDELAVFNKALSDAQVLSLYRLVADEQRVSMKPSAGGQQPPGNRQ